MRNVLFVQLLVYRTKQTRAETIHGGFDFVRFVLLGSEFDSFSYFRFGPFLFLATLMQEVNKLRLDI